MVYDSEIWAEKLNVQNRHTHSLPVQRAATLRITSAYRTVSTPAGNYMTGSFRQNTITIWQQKWVNEDTGSWHITVYQERLPLLFS